MPQLKKVRKILLYILLVLLLINLLIAAWLPLHNDAHYFPDNARDMLLMNEIMTEKPITLIGPRSGISGVFHGPLWLYMNLPAFIASGGDVVGVAWFWFFLFAANVVIVYRLSRNIFGHVGGLVSAVLFSFAFTSTGWSQFNANGVLLVMPFFIYYLLEYFEYRSFVHMFAIFLLIGLLIQFQIAFGLPILILTLLLASYLIRQSGRMKHLWAFGAVFIPTLTHILFDVRHNFIQLRSLLGYSSSGGVSFFEHAVNRLRFGFLELSSWIPDNSYVTSLVLVSVIAYIIYRSKDSALRRIGLLYMYFYIGFWIVTLSYSGTMWPYYYWGLTPVLFLVIGGVISKLSKRVQVSVLGLMIIVQLFIQVQWFQHERDYVLAPRPISWKFHENVVEEIFEQAPETFGYYVFSDDLFGYRPKYAFTYWGNKFEGKTALLNKKLPQIYTYMMPTESVDLTWEGWLKHNVRIDRSPDTIDAHENGIAVYKYVLSEEEQAIESDPFLLDSLIFR